MRTIAGTAGLRPLLMRMPFALWDAVAGLAEMLPHPPLTRNQVELMQVHTTASESRPGFRVFPRDRWKKSSSKANELAQSNGQ